jgi:hypothetical protein
MVADEQSGEFTAARAVIDATRSTYLASFAPFPDLAMRRIEARDWFGYLLLFGYQSLRAAFLKILPELNSEPPEVYWSILGQVWSAAEAPDIEEDVNWRALFADPRPKREYLMDVDDKRAYECLPEIVQVYRGAGHPDFVLGLSWTRDYEEAAWFAGHARTTQHRSRAPHHLAAADAQEPCVAHGSVARADVIALLSDDQSRAESGIIALPESIVVVTIERLDRRMRVGGCDDELALRDPLRSSRRVPDHGRSPRPERVRQRMASGSAPAATRTGGHGRRTA